MRLDHFNDAFRFPVRRTVNGQESRALLSPLHIVVPEAGFRADRESPLDTIEPSRIRTAVFYIGQHILTVHHLDVGLLRVLEVRLPIYWTEFRDLAFRIFCQLFFFSSSSFLAIPPAFSLFPCCSGTIVGQFFEIGLNLPLVPQRLP